MALGGNWYLVKILLSLTLIVMIFVVVANGQNISDKDRLAFNSTNPISIDLDGDGHLVKILPHTYIVRGKKWSRRKHSIIKTEKHWIAFDLQTAHRHKTKNVFRYQYGTEQADYWSYALVLVSDLNKDGRKDLLFYAGDDTTEERVFLLNVPGKFRIYKRRVNDLSK